MKKTMALFSVLAFVCAVAQALDDTPANRKQEVERYLKAVPVREVFSDMADQMVKTMPEDQQREFKETLTKYLDVPAIEKAISDAMAKHFTADEIKALTDFYSSPVGKSAMKKLGAYSADVMPAIQQEVEKASEKAAAAAQPSEKPAPAETKEPAPNGPAKPTDDTEPAAPEETTPPANPDEAAEGAQEDQQAEPQSNESGEGSDEVPAEPTPEEPAAGK